MTQSLYPEYVTFYSLMAIQAARRASHVGGGYRLYVFAKALDQRGLGRVSRDDLRAFVLRLGVNGRTYERWLTQARNYDLVRDLQDKNHEWWLLLPSAGNAAVSMGCDPYLGIGHKIEMAARDLIGKGWRARIQAAWESGKTISREKIQKVINVSVRAQKYRAAQMGEKLIRTRNYSISALKADQLSIIREHSNHKAPFITRDGFIAWRLPDTRTATHATTLGKGRMQKANKILRRGLSLREQALGADEGKHENLIRLFNSTPTQRRSTERKLSLADNARVEEIYELVGEARHGAVMWKHCPVR